MTSGQQVHFPVTFRPGDRVVVPGPGKSCQELAIECKEEIRFDSVEEFWDYVAEHPVSQHFAYTLRSRPN